MNREPEAFHDDESFYPSRDRYELIKFKVKNRVEYFRPYLKGKTVLDVGCGSGFQTNEWSKSAKYICGMDVDTEVIEYARKHYPHLKFYIHDARKPFIIDGVVMFGFEIVCCTETVEHMSADDGRKMLRNIRAALLPGGVFLGSTPRNQTNIKDPDHIKEYTTEELENLLNEFFTTVEIETVNVVAPTHHFKCWK